MFKISQYRGVPCVKVKVSPGASKNNVTGTWEDALRMSVQAPPEKGKANDEICHFLAKLLGLKKTDVSVVQGEKSRQKLIAFQHCTEEKITAGLQKALEGKK